MVRMIRLKTPFGLAIAANKEINSITYGQWKPCHLTPHPLATPPAPRDIARLRRSATKHPKRSRDRSQQLPPTPTPIVDSPAPTFNRTLKRGNAKWIKLCELFTNQPTTTKDINTAGLAAIEQGWNDFLAQNDNHKIDEAIAAFEHDFIGEISDLFFDFEVESNLFDIKCDKLLDCWCESEQSLNEIVSEYTEQLLHELHYVTNEEPAEPEPHNNTLESETLDCDADRNDNDIISQSTLNPNAPRFFLPPPPTSPNHLPDNHPPPQFHLPPIAEYTTTRRDEYSTEQPNGQPQQSPLHIDTLWYPNSPCPNIEPPTSPIYNFEPPHSPFHNDEPSFHNECLQSPHSYYSFHNNDFFESQSTCDTLPSHDSRSTEHGSNQIVAASSSHPSKERIVKILTQNIQGDFTTESKSIISQMQTHSIHATCIQETWFAGNDMDFERENYHLFHHNKSQRSSTRGHIEGGVAIILSPIFYQAYLRARAKNIEIITTPPGKFEGRVLGIPLSFPNIDNWGKKIKGNLDFFLFSIYHPVDSKEFQAFNDLLPQLFRKIPHHKNGKPKLGIIIGHDVNCNVGTRNSPNSDEYSKIIGPHGIDNRNKKGCELLHLLNSFDLRITNSYYQKPSYTTWRSFNNLKTRHMLDVISCSTNLFKYFQDCGLTFLGAKSDHGGTLAKLHLNTISYKGKAQDVNAGDEDYEAIMYQPDKNEHYNDHIRLNSPGPNPNYTSFFQGVKLAAKSTATKLRKKSPEWFIHSQKVLQPVIASMLEALNRYRNASADEAPALKLEKDRATKLRNLAVEQAKSVYMRFMSEKMNKLDKQGWQAINYTKLGDDSNYSKPKKMSLRLANGNRATNDKENMSVMLPHCTRIFNNAKLIHPEALKYVVECETSTNLDSNITWKEFMAAVMGLKNDKSPGANTIPAEAFKAMDEENLRQVYNFIVDFWEGDADYDEWHEGLGVPVPKIKDPEDPNKYRIVNLMDVCSKIFSRILTARAYKLATKNCTKYQFGGTPKTGCADANFTLKTLLHLRHQHNLESYVIFADLVKAFDTADHKLLIAVLEKYGAPPKFRRAIERLYDGLKVVLKVGSETEEISQTVGVRQGDNLSPVIFLFLMSAFAETLEAEWDLAGLPKASFNRVSDTDLVNGQLTGHDRNSLSTGDIFQVIQILYVDDGAFVFESREDAKLGLEVIHKSFKRLGLELHLGHGETKSKTEAMFIPGPAFFRDAEANSLPACPTNNPPNNLTNTPTTNPADDTVDDDGQNVPTPTLTTSKSSSKSNKKKTKKPTKVQLARKHRERIYQASPLTDRIHTEAGFIDFCMHFKYLGSYLSFDLTDDFDIENRLASANSAMGALKHFWNNQYADLHTKVAIFKAIPLNLLLWGCETWALRESHLNSLDVFLHRSIRRILGITITQVQDERIKNESIRKTFYNIPDIRAQIAIRQMSFLGKIVRGPNHHPPKLLLPAWCNHPRLPGGVLTTNKKSLVKSLQLLLPEQMQEMKEVKNRQTGELELKSVPNNNGRMNIWLDLALDEKLWDWHIEKLRQPGVDVPPPAQNNSNVPPPPPPPPSPRRSNNRRSNPQATPPRRHRHNNNRHQPPSPRSNHTSTNYDPELVGSNKRHALRALGLPNNATERDVRVKFRRLSMIYHPDKYSPQLGISQEDATAHFQTLNNAYEYLRSIPL